jgi:hypothetical protein
VEFDLSERGEPTASYYSIGYKVNIKVTYLNNCLNKCSSQSFLLIKATNPGPHLGSKLRTSNICAISIQELSN